MIRRMTPIRLLSLCAAVLVLSAAECPVDDVTPVGPGPNPTNPTPTTLTRVSGDNQSGIVGQPLAAPLVVRVDDQSGNAMSGVSVTFGVAQGGGTVSPTSATTDASGLAQATWTLGTNAAQTQQARATVGSTLSALFAATVTHGAAGAVGISAGDGQQVLQGLAVPVAPTVLVSDQYGNPVQGASVTFAVTGGGGSVTGATTTTNASGVATVGSWTLGAGANTLTATVAASGVTGNPVTFTATGLLTLFDIEIRWASGTPSQPVVDAFNNAVTKWQSIIIGELPDQAVNLPTAGTCGGAARPAITETVDDVVIYVEFAYIDGPYAVQGQAGPCVVRGSTWLPSVGGMLFDDADTNRLVTSGDLEKVVMHEMAHVLGFGTIWEYLGLLQEPSDPAAGGTVGADTYFSGPLAVAAFDSIYAESYPGSPYVGNKVPVENDNATYGTGSLDGHWRESLFGIALMTPTLQSGQVNPLSVVTVASMADLGYGVRYQSADPFVMPAAMPLVASGPGRTTGLDDDIWKGPIMVVDETGRVVRVVGR